MFFQSFDFLSEGADQLLTVRPRPSDNRKTLVRFEQTFFPLLLPSDFQSPTQLSHVQRHNDCIHHCLGFGFHVRRDWHLRRPADCSLESRDREKLLRQPQVPRLYFLNHRRARRHTDYHYAISVHTKVKDKPAREACYILHFHARGSVDCCLHRPSLLCVDGGQCRAEIFGQSQYRYTTCHLVWYRGQCRRPRCMPTTSRSAYQEVAKS